tara:strand:- start:1435 stop:2160 length:726 start_codon:yes stop_codon:yes gene_type:complete
MTIKYIIPSFQRCYKFTELTYQFLQDQDIDLQDVWLILREDDPQLDLYGMLPVNHLITDTKGIGMTHNEITSYFDEGDYLVELDDDLKKIIDINRKPITNFKEVCKTMFTNLESKKLSFGGTYSVANPMFMKGCKEYTTDLRYCLGCVRFRINRKDIILHTNYAEDFENCILHYLRDGGILKNNWISPVTKNYAPGGCDGDGRNIDTEKKDKEHLVDSYPDLCVLFQRKNGKWDLRLKDKN